MGDSGAAQLQDLLAHADWLTRLAGHLVREEDAAHDLVQETWLAAMRSPPRADRPVRPWLAEVLRNFAFRRHREERRRQRREQNAVAQAGPPISDSAEEVLERAQLQRVLAERVMELEEPLRTVLLLRYYEGESAAEIARKLQIPPGTVRWRLKEGRDRLRGELDQIHGNNRSAWTGVLVPTSLPMSWSPLEGVTLMAKTKSLAAPVVALALLATLITGVVLWRQSKTGPTTAQGASYLSPETGRGGLRVFGATTRPPGAVIAGQVLSADGQPAAQAMVAATLAARGATA